MALNFDFLEIQVKSFDLLAFKPTISFIGVGKGFSPQGKLFWDGDDIEVKLAETKISAVFLFNLLTELWGKGALLPIPPLAGNLQLKTDFHLNEKGLRHLALDLQSQDFKIAPSQILGVNVPEIDIGKLQIVVATEEEGKKLQLQNVSLGGPKNSLSANLSGEINLTPGSFLDSQIQATASFSLAPSLLNEGPGIFCANLCASFTGKARSSTASAWATPSGDIKFQ